MAMEPPSSHTMCPDCNSWMEKEVNLRKKFDLLEREGVQNRKTIRQLAREVKRLHIEKGSLAAGSFAAALHRTESSISDADTNGSVGYPDEVSEACSLMDELGNLKSVILSLRELSIRQEKYISVNSVSTALLRQILSAVAVVKQSCSSLATGSTQPQNDSAFPKVCEGNSGPPATNKQVASTRVCKGLRQTSEAVGLQQLVASPEISAQSLPEEVTWESLVSQALQNVPNDEDKLLQATVQASGDCRNFLHTLGRMQRRSGSTVTTTEVVGAEAMMENVKLQNTSANPVQGVPQQLGQELASCLPASRPGSMMPYVLSKQAFMERGSLLMEWNKR